MKRQAAIISYVTIAVNLIYGVVLTPFIIRALGQGGRLYERETLDSVTRYNELVMTALRTREGLSLDLLASRFGPRLSAYCKRMAVPYLISHKLEESRDGHLRLTRAGIFVSDGIISDLMYVE